MNGRIGVAIKRSIYRCIDLQACRASGYFSWETSPLACSGQSAIPGRTRRWTGAAYRSYGVWTNCNLRTPTNGRHSSSSQTELGTNEAIPNLVAFNIEKFQRHFDRDEEDDIVILMGSENVNQLKSSGLDGMLEYETVEPGCLLPFPANSLASGLEASFVSVDATEHKQGSCEASLDGRSVLVHNRASDVGNSSAEDCAVPTDRLQSKSVDDLLDLERASQYPVPLSPFSGEVAKSIEYERAMVAETAMKSGPAMTRNGVLFEDEWLLVINKPSGIYSEHVLATVPSLLTPTASLPRESSLSRLFLRHRVANIDSSGTHMHMANRLDRDTSGVMVITKRKDAAAKLSNIFSNRQVQKSYIGLCSAPRPSWRKVTVESGHGRSRFGAWRVYSKKDVGRSLPGGSVVRDMMTNLVVMAINKQHVSDEPVGRSILEEIDVIDNYVIAGDGSVNSILRPSPCDVIGSSSKDSSSKESSYWDTSDQVLIRAIPLTGRTHQIRLHCQFLGLPLVGDVKYGGPHFHGGVRYDHHALHAESLSFKHPFTFEALHFVAPLPQWAIDGGVQPLAV